MRNKQSSFRPASIATRVALVPVVLFTGCLAPESPSIERKVSMRTQRTLAVEFLYLDLTTCGRCIGTAGSLKAAVDRLSPTLAEVGVELAFRKVHVKNEEEARKHRLEISPTVRINGRDVQPDWEANECGECGELCCSGSTRVECRLWDWDGEKHTTAPVPLLMHAILAESFSGEESVPPEGGTDDVPDNLKRFFSAKVSSRQNPTEEACEAACNCGPDCC